MIDTAAQPATEPAPTAAPAPAAPEKPATPAAPAPAEAAKPAPAAAASVLDIDDEAPEAEGTEASADDGDGEAPDLSAYVYEPPEGQTLNEGAQENIDAFAAFSAKSGLEPEQFNQSIDFFNGLVAQQRAKMAEADEAHKTERLAVLTEEWGDDFKANLKVAQEGEKLLPESLRVALKDARTPDGRRVVLMPEFAQLLHQLAGKPAIANAKPFDMEATDARIREIERVRNRDFSDYITDKLDVELAELTARKAAHTQPARPVPPSADEKREAAILKVLKSNYPKYYAEGLDKELAQIRQRRGAT